MVRAICRGGCEVDQAISDAVREQLDANGILKRSQICARNGQSALWPDTTKARLLELCHLHVRPATDQFHPNTPMYTKIAGILNTELGTAQFTAAKCQHVYKRLLRQSEQA